MDPTESPRTADAAVAADRLRARAEARRRRLLASQDVRSRRVLGGPELSDRAAENGTEKVHVSAVTSTWSCNSQQGSSPAIVTAMRPAADSCFGGSADSKALGGDAQNFGERKTTATEVVTGDDACTVTTGRESEGLQTGPSSRAGGPVGCAVTRYDESSNCDATETEGNIIRRGFSASAFRKEPQSVERGGGSGMIGYLGRRFFEVALSCMIAGVVRPLSRLKPYLGFIQYVHGVFTFLVAFASATLPPFFPTCSDFCSSASSYNDDVTLCQGRTPCGDEAEKKLSVLLLTVLVWQPVLLVLSSSVLLVIVDSAPAVLQWYDHRKKSRQSECERTQADLPLPEGPPVSGRSGGDGGCEGREQEGTVLGFASLLSVAVVWFSRLLVLMQWARALLRVAQQVAIFITLYCFIRCGLVWLTSSRCLSHTDSRWPPTSWHK
ncbi:hypothetical protein CSUI_003643 [Cystoisospora suis]|uniref:Transmembrane protein n=1 Tax=Cystoisospora suis TaxID=483139 RepID=A0A2C6KEQ8_9APIC|nr:hypothetical protein CSUI_003643 [Cystoisospora suis]